MHLIDLDAHSLYLHIECYQSHHTVHILLQSQITLLATKKEGKFFPMHAMQPVGGVEE